MTAGIYCFVGTDTTAFFLGIQRMQVLREYLMLIYAWLHLPDMELLAYTVKEFYDQLEPAADSLERAYGQIADAAYLERYRIQVHAMKSLSATIGIVTLSGVARVLESAAKDDKIHIITAMTDIFLEKWRSYRYRLQGSLKI